MCADTSDYEDVSRKQPLDWNDLKIRKENRNKELSKELFPQLHAKQNEIKEPIPNFPVDDYETIMLETECATHLPEISVEKKQNLDIRALASNLI